MTAELTGRTEIDSILKEFPDPEMGRSAYKFGQIQDVSLSGDQLSLTLALTTYSAPVWEETRAELRQKLLDGCSDLKQVDIQEAIFDRPAEKIGEIGLRVKNVIAVGSGKGGVGKSTIAASIALGLHKSGAKVGLMDADIYGPSLPILLGLEGRPEVEEYPAPTEEDPNAVGRKLKPIYSSDMPVMSMGFLVPPGEAVVWRGPMLHGAITQFLRDTNWGELDYLIIDMPPGTGDISLTLSQLLPLTGAVVVCTPQDVALLDATKAIAMYQKVGIPVLGLVENMSYFNCTDCGSRHEIFGNGGAKNSAAELNLPFLGEVPINLQIRIRGDQGRTIENIIDEESAQYLMPICHKLIKGICDANREKPSMPVLPVL